MKNAYQLLFMRQVDAKLKQLKALRQLQPNQGWITYIREALSLPTAQLAKLMGFKQSSVFAMERREQDKTITLETLDKLANAMGCDLVYAFVPKTSLEDFVEKKRKSLIEKLITQTHLTMSLEKQGLTQQDLEHQKNLLRDVINHKPMKYLWRNL